MKSQPGLIFGGLNMVIGKAAILYLGYKRGIDFSNWISSILFSTLGAAIGTVLIPSVLGLLAGFIG